MAYNYATEDKSFFEPAVDIRMYDGDSGEVYHELPVTYWLTGQVWKYTGIKNFVPRLIAMLFNLTLIWGAFYFALALGLSRQRSLWFSFFMTFSPMYFYYMPSLVPNQLGLTFFIAALAILLPTLDDEKYSLRYIFGTFVLVVATLAKPTYLFYGLPIATWVIYNFLKDKNYKKLIKASIVGVFVLVSNALVIRNAKRLYEASPWERAIHTPIGPAGFASSMDEFLRKSFYS